MEIMKRCDSFFGANVSVVGAAVQVLQVLQCSSAAVQQCSSAAVQVLQVFFLFRELSRQELKWERQDRVFTYSSFAELDVQYVYYVPDNVAY